MAISDSARTLAFPRPALEVDDRLVVNLAALVEEESVSVVVVGRPVALSGKATISTERADEFFATLVEALAPCAVLQWDERLTTTQATRSLSGAGHRARDHRQRVDSAAAVIMLQNYLDGLDAN